MNSTISNQMSSSSSNDGGHNTDSSSSRDHKNFKGIDLTHQTIGGYRVLHRLGVGGMAEVYLAFHETLQRHVALKVLRSDLASSADHATRFLQEARAAASLIHPNIVQVYDIGSADGIQYIAQEYISGTTLRNLIDRRGTLNVAEGLSIMLQIASALVKASSIGVVHRDIKPDNILLTPEGEVKVADFGLARARSQNSNLTEVGVALGTPIYMSPEQIQGKSVDQRSDLYSLGITAYEMFTGRPPFHGDTPLALAMQHVQNVPTNLCELRADLDPEVAAIIHQLLEKDLDARIASASDLSRSIRKTAERLSLSISLDHPLPLSGIILDMPLAMGQHTTRLQSLALLNGTRKTRWGKQQLLTVLSAIAIAFGSGYLVWGWDRSPVIAPPATLVSSVKKRLDIREQYFYAMASNNLADWRAVEEFFPPEVSPIHRNYNIKAWLHLAWRGIEVGNVQEAMIATQKILRAAEVEPAMRVLALVARSLGHQKLGITNESDSELSRAETEFASLSDIERKRVEESLPAAARSLWYSDR